MKHWNDSSCGGKAPLQTTTENCWKTRTLAADPDRVPALPVLFPLTFLRAFALRICTHILFQMAGEKPYEVRVSWDSPASRRRAAADLVSGCEKSEGLKNWLWNFYKKSMKKQAKKNFEVMSEWHSGFNLRIFKCHIYLFLLQMTENWNQAVLYDKGSLLIHW